MFTVDYQQRLADHGKVLVLVKNFEPACKAELFHQTFLSIASHHALIYPKQSVSRLTNLHFNRVRNESLMDLPSDIHSDMSSNNMVRDQPIWMRYVRDLCSFNTAWASFQSHRAVLGLIGFCCCTTQDQMVPAIQAYLQQKALISETPINGRFFILIPAMDQTNSTLSIEEANEIILAEYKKLPQSLLLTTDEILAHPAEQVFNTDILSLRHSSCDLPSLDHTDPSGLASLNGSQTQSNSSHAAILNPRLVGALTELASNIYRSLEKLVLIQDPKSAKISALSNIDISDNDSSESGIGGLSLPVDTATSKSTESGSSDEHRFISKPYTGSSTTDGMGTSPVQTDSGFKLFGVNKHRKLTAQRNKHLGDICLQMGELDLAQFYYETALQLLRPLMVQLWIAGAMEGLCAVVVARRTYRSKSSDLLSPTRRSLRNKALANGASEKAVSKSSDFSAGLDLASQRAKQPSSQVTSGDLCGNALEALEIYKKAQTDVGLLEETAFKVAHLLVSEKQTTKACELLDSLHAGTFDDRIDMTVNQSKRLSALVGLYRDLGYVRRASLVAWQAFGQNIKLPTVNEFDILFTSLYINVISSASFNESESYWMEPSSTTTDKSHSQTKRALTPTTMLHRPAIPTSLSPVVRQHRSVWYPGSTGSTQLRVNRSTTGANKYKRSGRNPRPNKSVSALEHSDFHPIGWSQLQAAVLWQIVESYKMEVKFDDATEISWDRGLQLIGFIFSLLDAWPCQLNKTQCASFMEDVCRLAVFRSPDQPRIAPNTVFPFKADMSGNVVRYLRSRQGTQMTATQNDGVESPQERPIVLRQLVDLIEVPVHQLPAFQSINLVPLPAYLLPNELSKDGLASAVPLSSPSPSSDCSDLKPAETPFLVNSGSRPAGLFEYSPNDSDALGTGSLRTVEWVCEEPVHLELIVDNLLPVDLRISELHVELIPFRRPLPSIRSPLSPPSSARTLESANLWPTDQSLQPVIRLEAVRLVLEAPGATINDMQSDNEKPVVKSLEGTYVIQLNEACLLEAAEHRRLHPQSKLDPHWRRRMTSLSCSLPGNTSNIRLVVSVLPTAEMLAMDFFSNDSNAPLLYRVCGITYRLVDFGGMHVCLRAPTQSLSLDNVSNTAAASNQDQPLAFARERRLSNSSSSAFSTISNLRSSYNSGIDSLLHFAPPPSESKAEHPTTATAKMLFVNLPCIRMRPPMPRLCVFPGIVRSAHDFHEAVEFLPDLTTPSVGRKQRQVQTKVSQSLTTVPNHVQPPRFEPPMSDYWSENVASVIVVSLYPYESRWLPLQLFMRDEVIAKTVDVPSMVRRLNVLRVMVKSTNESLGLLRKLQLSPGDIMQCVGFDSIHKKLPLPIINKELDAFVLSDQPDVDEEITPIRATECGLLWLNFKSEPIWEAVSKFAINSSDTTQTVDRELSFRFSKTLRLEFEVEYAVEVSSNLLGCSFLSRRVSLGIHLTALSSKHAPILLYYPQLSFRDEPFDDNSDSDGENSDCADEDRSTRPEVIRSKTFFNCTLRARLSPSLVPRPVRLLQRQYRVRLEINTRWRTTGLVFGDSNTQLSYLRTPWTTLTEQTFNSRASYSPTKASQPPEFFRMDSALSSNAVSCIEYPDDSTSRDESMSQTASTDRLYQHVCLPLDCVSDTLFTGKRMMLINPDTYRPDEVGLPILAYKRALIHLLESHIEIAWQSTLHGRLLPSSEFRASSAELLTKRKVVLPDPRFYRHGRFLLGAHDAELSSAERQIGIIDPKTDRHVLPTPKPWYGTAFSTLGSMAGVLWCHNLHLDISLDISAKSCISGQADRAGLCDECHGQPRRVSRRSIFSRRMTQPWMAQPHSDWQFMLGDSRVNRPSQPQMTNEDQLAAVRARRFSVPELHSPHHLKGVNTKLLTSAFVTCVSLLEPLTIIVRGWVDKHPFEGMDVTVDSADLANSPISHLKLYRVWTGPVVYEVHHITDPDSSATTSECTELSPPLTEGKDYGFVGNAGGVIGLSLASETSRLFEQTGSIIFFRPGRFWICGVLGLLKPNFILPSLDSTDLTCFSLPSVADVETVRFSPHGITVHVGGRR